MSLLLSTIFISRMFARCCTAYVAPRAMLPVRHSRTFYQFKLSSQDDTNELKMENLYQNWSVEDDRTLFDNRDQPLPKLASMLGRGLSGVEKRLKKLTNVESSAYQRLFAGEIEPKPEKLVPVSEVIRRIEYDYMLNPEDFTILHYDRVEDRIVESPFNASNDSIAGKAKTLVEALPEHRIMSVKYKERVVWDKNERRDHVFSNEGIYKVIETYDDWKSKRDEQRALALERQEQVANHIRRMLGVERFERLKASSQVLQALMSDETVSIKLEIERYVSESIALFREVREDPSSSIDPYSIPMSDFYAIEQLSELVSSLPDKELRVKILGELEIAQQEAEGKKVQRPLDDNLPELNESDLEEKFVKGSGAGGQKINKTSSKVVLLHIPTRIRVECQDTRSLQQNRKIARRRLRLKLDEHYNGSQSKMNIMAEKAAQKKARAKNRNKARQRKKKEEADDKS